MITKPSSEKMEVFWFMAQLDRASRLPIGKVSITINDNGLEIKEKHVPQIFKMFYRATSASTGTGLDLFIVSETIEKMGGTIKVESTYDKGTSFKIELPYVIK